jgi:transcription-repair coupling factor (superfamily II helicase)
MNEHNLPFELPQKPGDTLKLGQLVGSSLALICAKIIEQHQGLVLIITDDMQKTSRLYEELKQFTPQENRLLPDWETLPYDSFSPYQDIISDRLACLYQLMYMRKGALLIPVTSLMQKYCPPSFLTGHVFILSKGQIISPEAMRLQLANAGYRSVDQVMAHGEYATRGALLDIFPMGSDIPYRLDFLHNEIDGIRTFDIDNQRTIEKIESVQLLPAHEFPFDKQAIELFRSQWRENFEVRREPESLYQQVSKGILPSGIEYWQPLFFKEPLVSLFAYLPANTLVITLPTIQSAAEKHWRDIKQRYESRKVDPMRPLLAPEKIWMTASTLLAELKNYPKLSLSPESLTKKAHHDNLSFSLLPNITIANQHKEPLQALQQFCELFTGQIIFSVESEGRREVLQGLLQQIKIRPVYLSSLTEINDQHRFYLIIGASEQGFIDNTQHMAFITENELMGQRIVRRKQRDNKHTINTDTLIRSLAELTPGKPVVHLEHGVGRYAGLTTLETNGIMGEYLMLLYANDTKLYVPVSSLNLISRYSGGDEELAPLHKLGTDAWSKARQKAAEKIRDVAAELLDIYAERETRPGFQFKQDHEQYQLFNQGFPYQLTDDQQNAIGAVIGDMCSPSAMDRLVCGDVGFGKTEVAIRAAFLAVMNHKQVAILVPTTLLAQQHDENLRNRFANWPIRIETLSRFKTAKQQKEILQAIAEGKVDIVIGTHKLLQTDVKWYDLGLLIVDEEHRFGVRQKERIKAMRANVDILTLTATPIPRTLNMAMSGIRDLSIIATPPARRLAVKTFVRESDDLVIREAILREILRGGQVYYLYNDVKSIEKTAEDLRHLVPEARIAVAHGQMNERELEKIMNDFYHRKCNVLVCSTIIETGIDNPNANTIIIDRADKFGLAQLHQLRGRVGRSYHQAYAYLLTPPAKAITTDAKKRLEAISLLEDLGAGFALATHDLEIRGAGELLGEDQSGQIETIGFSLYMELLENAVASLKQGEQPTLEHLLNHNQTDIELRLPALIPDEFIPNVNTRLSLYKRIASAVNEQELNDIKIEMIDRFGLLPDPVKFLLTIAALRLTAQSLGIKRIELSDKGGIIEFSDHHLISVDYLIMLIQTHSQDYRLDGNNRLKLLQQGLSRQERIEYIATLLQNFTAHSQLISK